MFDKALNIDVVYIYMYIYTHRMHVVIVCLVMFAFFFSSVYECVLSLFVLLFARLVVVLIARPVWVGSAFEGGL